MLNRAFRHPLVIAAAAVAFGLGLAFPGASPARALPETVVPVPETTDDLQAWNAYYQALQQAKDRFYGEMPGDMDLTYAAVRGMLRTLDDPFTRFMDPVEYKSTKEENVGDYVGIGAYLDSAPTAEGYITIRRTVPKGPAAHAGLKAGDAITHVDGKPVKGVDSDQLSEMIRGAPHTAVRITIHRPAPRGHAPRTLVVRVVRAPVEFEVVDDSMKEGGIGYVHLSLFNQHSAEQVTHSIRQMEKRGMKGLILDLRDNPGGVLEAAIDIVSSFLPPDNKAVVIVEAGGRREAVPCNAKKYLHLKVPLVVLIDGDSASAAEILAGAIKDTHVGTLIGETTYGKGLVQSVIELPGGSATAITSAKYLTSKGNDINRTEKRRGGVEPDIKVDLTERDILANKDPQLDRAMQFLREKIARR